MSTGDRTLDHVWVVNRVDEVDGLYVFEDEHRARDFAGRHADAVVSEEVVMNDSAAAQFLIDTAEEDPDEEPYDHSRAKEDRRNGFDNEPPARHLSEPAALDAIAVILRDPDWAPGMLEDIGEIVAGTGRDIEGDGEPTWDRH
jgi:hypothetical protein